MELKAIAGAGGIRKKKRNVSGSGTGAGAIQPLIHQREVFVVL